MVAVIEWISNHWMTSILIFFSILILMGFMVLFNDIKLILRYRLKHYRRCCTCDDGEDSK